MRVLTLKPEWASLVLSGEKMVENRTWRNNDIIGRRLAIHRGGKDGAIVCTVRVMDIVSVKAALEMFPEQEDYICGPWCWILGELQEVEPVYCKGALGLWTVPDGQIKPAKERVYCNGICSDYCLAGDEKDVGTIYDGKFYCCDCWDEVVKPKLRKNKRKQR